MIFFSNQVVSSRNSSRTDGAPAFLRFSLYAVLVVSGFASYANFGGFSPLPVTVLLDIWISVFLLISIVRSRGKLPLSLLSSGIALLGLVLIILALSNQAPIYELGQSYRWLFYLLVYTVVVGQAWGPAKEIVGLTWVLLVMAFTKSMLSIFVAPEATRPGLFVENNFELALFAGLVAVSYTNLGKARHWAVAFLGLVTLLDGSRSGSIAFVLVGAYAVLLDFPRVKTALTFLRTGGAVLAMGAIPLLIFASRDSGKPVGAFLLDRLSGIGRLTEPGDLATEPGDLATEPGDLATEPGGELWENLWDSINSIDRVTFLKVFINETDQWSVWSWIFGTYPVTALSAEGCSRLDSWGPFSSEGDGSCYAVIFHAFVLRVIYDAGFFGLILVFGVIIYVLAKAGVPWQLDATILGIALTNSFSVSGPNNPFVALVVLLGILHAGTLQRTPRRVVEGPATQRAASTHPGTGRRTE